MPLWGFLLSFVVAIMWAASPIMVARGMALSKCTSNEINPIRSISFFLVTLTFVLTKGNIPIITSPKPLLCIGGNVLLGYIIGDGFYFIAIKKIGAGLAVSAANSYAILVVFTSWFILGEKINLQIILGVIVIIIGLTLLRLGEDRIVQKEKIFVLGKVGVSKVMEGLIFALCAGIAWAIAAPLNKLAMETSSLDPVGVSFYRAIYHLIFAWGYRLLLLICCSESTVPLKRLSLQTWLYFLGAGIIGLALNSIFYSTCIRKIPVAIVTSITSTSPFFAVFFAQFVLKEKMSLIQWAGVVLIICGSVTVSI